MQFHYQTLRRRVHGFAVLVTTVLAAGAACTGTRAPAVSPATTIAAEPVRAMTFNIRYGTANDGEDAWPLRRELTFRAIREYAPAVLGVQEALRFQLDETAREFPDYREIGVGRDDGIARGEYSAILYDARRLEVLDHGTFWLSDTPEVAGSTTWGNRITRLATWGRFRDRAAAGATFYVFNTHWDHESQPSRERSAALILERIRARAAPDPVLLMGDFNAGEDNPAFQALLAARGAAGSLHLYDTFRALHPDARDTGTYHAFRGDRSGPKIDAILASSEWETLESAIVTLNANGRYPSDHFPVTATLSLRARPPPDGKQEQKKKLDSVVQPTLDSTIK